MGCVVTWSLVFPVVEHLAPVFVTASHQGELIGIEVDFGHGVAFASRVYRVKFREERSLVNFGTRGLHNHDTGGVVAAGGAHSLEAGFMEFLEDLHTGGVECPLAVIGTAVPRVVHTRFVSGSENEVFVVSGELGGDLGPVRFLLGGDCVCRAVYEAGLVVAFAIKDVVFEPAAVPVAVQNGVHAVVDDEVHDRLHGVEPASVDGAVGGVGVPSARNTHGRKTSVLDCLHVSGVRERVAPKGRIFRNFHRVSDVVAETHQRINFGCLGKSKCRSCGQKDRASGDAKGVQSHV